MNNMTLQDLFDLLKSVNKTHIQKISVSDRIAIKKQIDRINQLISISNHLEVSKAKK